MPLAELARTEIADLQAQGIHPTADEIVWLNELAIEVECPAGRVPYHSAGEPVRMGSQIMWPFTVGSAEWWAKVANGKAFITPDGSRNALAFCLCNGRQPEVFADLLTVDDAREAVNKWVMRCGATADERNAAILRCVPEIGAPHVLHSKGDKTAAPDASDTMVAELEAGTGLPGEYWRGQLQSHAVKCLRAVYRQAALGVGGGGSDGKTEYREAMHRFMLASNAIKRAHRDGEV